MGGLVTAVKPEEPASWAQRSGENGRSRSVILFDENEGYNFMQCELARHGMDGIGTVVECMMRILEGAKRASPTASQKGEEPIWENSSRQLFRYTIPPLYAATGTLEISDIIRMVCSAPTSYEEVTDKNWQGRSFMYEIMNKAANDPVVAMSPEALRAISLSGQRSGLACRKRRAEA